MRIFLTNYFMLKLRSIFAFIATQVYFCSSLLATDAVTIDSVINRLKNFLTCEDNVTCENNVENRIRAIQEILEVPLVKSNIVSYQLNKMMTIIGSGDDSDESYSLTKLLDSEENTGYSGDSIGEATVFGRLNALSYIIVQNMLLDPIGDYTDTALEQGRTLWSQLKWLIDEITVNEGSIDEQIEEIKKSITDIYKLQIKALNLLDPIESEQPEHKDENELQGSSDSIKLKNLLSEDAQTLWTKAEEWANETENSVFPGDLNSISIEIGNLSEDRVSKKIKDAALAILTKADSAFQILTAVQNIKTEVQIPTSSFFLELGTDGETLKKKVDEVEKKILILKYGSQLKSDLGVYDDPYSIDPYTVCSFLHLIQSCLRGTVSLIDKVSLIGQISQEGNDNSLSLIDQYNKIKETTEKLKLAVINLDKNEAESLSSTISLLSKTLLADFNDFYAILLDKIVVLSDAKGPFAPYNDENKPNLFNETYEATCAFLKGLKENKKNLDLASIVRNATYIWPMLLREVTGSEPKSIEKEVFTGKYIQPGLTLMNCLHDIQKVMFIDSLLLKMGRDLETAPSSSLLGKIRNVDEKFKTSDDSHEEKKATFDVETLMLFYNLLEKCPAIGQEKLPVSEESVSKELTENEEQPITFATYLAEKIGSRINDSKQDTLFNKLSNISSFNGLVNIIRDKFNAVIKSSLPSEFSGSENFSHYWFNYEKILAALKNNAVKNEAEKNEAVIDKESLIYELYSVPLLFKLRGIPGLEDTKSLRVKIAASNSENKGQDTDFWGLLNPSIYSVSNYMYEMIKRSSRILNLKQAEPNNEINDKKILMDLWGEKIEGLTDFSSLPNFYSALTENFYDYMTILAGKFEETYSGSVFERLQSNKDAYEKIKLCIDSINMCKSAYYPLDLYSIYSKLKKINEMDNDTLEKNFGTPDDHHLETTVFGNLNGILFECGSQLLINLIGEITDPGFESYGTLYAKVQQIEIQAQNLENVDLNNIQVNTSAIRTALGELSGAISYFYQQCIVGVKDNKFTDISEKITKSFDLKVDDLTQNSSDEGEKVWDFIVEAKNLFN